MCLKESTKAHNICCSKISLKTKHLCVTQRKPKTPGLPETAKTDLTWVSRLGEKKSIPKS